MDRHFSIGTPGAPRGDAEKLEWLQSQTRQRSYRDEGLSKTEATGDSFEVFRYGALSIDRERYPLIAVKVVSDREQAPWSLISGGVHGYETSEVQGALTFLQIHALAYRDRVNSSSCHVSALGLRGDRTLEPQRGGSQSLVRRR